MRDRRGSILIVSLWMLTILTLLVVTFAHKVAVESRLTGYQWDETRLAQVAKMSLAVSRVSLRPAPGTAAVSYGAMNRPWSQDPSFFRDHPVPGGSFTLSHRAGDEVLNGLEDEAGRVNVNTAPSEVLERLFIGAPDLAAQVLDRRRAHPFQNVEELLSVKGMTPLLFHQFKDLLTVDGDGRVNLNTATPAALGALGLEESLVRKVMDFRRGKDGREGTADDGIFPSESAAPALMSDFRDLSAEESASLANALSRKLLTAKAGPLRLNILARLEDGRSARTFTVVVPPGAPPGRILHWHEGAP